MAVSIRIDRAAGRDARALVEFARQAVKYRSGGLAAHVRLGYYKDEVPSENFLFAINMFRQMVDQEQGRLYVLDNSDVVIVYKGTRPHHVIAAVEKVRLLYSDVLLHAEKNRGGVEFCTWFNLKTEAEQFLRFAESILEEPQYDQPAAAPAAPGAAPQAQAVPAEVRSAEDPAAAKSERLDLSSPSAELGRLAKATERLGQINLAGVLRRQAVCVLRENSAPEPVFQELYLSIADLERALMPVGKLASDRWLFQYFTRLLDLRMLDMLSSERPSDLTGYFSVNLNVSSVLSPEFASFVETCPVNVRNTIVVELQKLDVFSDLGTFFYVRDMLRDHGFRLCMDGLTDLSLPFCDRARLGMDMMKVRWRADILKDSHSVESTEFASLIRKTDPTRVILCRADSDSAIQFGRSLGVSMFQGYQVDRLLEMRAVA
jgi:hypothetical protein